MSQLREMFTKIMNEYVPAKNQTFKDHPLGSYYRHTIPQILFDTDLIDQNKYIVKGSIGQRNQWADVSWFAIMNKNITSSPTKGVYIVYLLSKNGASIYLTLNQGCTEIKDNIKKQGKQKGKTQPERVIEKLHQNTKEIQKQLPNKDFAKYDKIYLGEDLSERALYYQNGTILYKEYKKSNLPPEEELLNDLKNMLKIYDEYAKANGYNSGGAITPVEKNITVKETISNIKKYIASQGFYYPDGTIENFYLSLKSKPFVILAGVSGTGKTRLARLFAEAIGAVGDTEKEKRYLLVPVRPDWSDSSDLFGHRDLNGKFIHGPILDFVKSAAGNKEKPYFLCLDEMNLARVEYYLSDVLSLIETRNFDGNEIKTDSLTSFQNISLPENLYIIGTVNMDETTFPFSKKVLDRANTIEFSDVNLIPKKSSKSDAPAQSLGNEFLKTKYLLLRDCMYEPDFVDENCKKLQKINEILAKANAQVGYRVRDEIIFYLLNNKKADLIPNDHAWDNAIMQKILPRIQGSSMLTQSILYELFLLCTGDKNTSPSDVNEMNNKVDNILNDSSDCHPYEKSAKKIAFMLRRYNEDGFTSYWF